MFASTVLGTTALRSMTRFLTLGGLAAMLLLGRSVASAEPLYEIDYATYDVRVTDSKGVVTDAKDFGFLSGPNILDALRGDAIVEIPFRRISTIEVSAYVPEKGISPCVVTTHQGKRYDLTLDRNQGQRFLGGDRPVEIGRIHDRVVHPLDRLVLGREQ